MRIGIDARNIFRTCPRGTGSNLLDLYSRIPLLDQKTNFCFYYEEDIEDSPLPSAGNIFPRLVKMRGYRFNLWEQIALPWRALRDSLDVLHCPAQTSPYLHVCPIVLTVHDLIPFDMPHDADPLKLNYICSSLSYGVKKAKKIIANSYFTKKKILERFRIPEEKITVIYWAPDTHYRPLEQHSAERTLRVREKYNLDRPYFFALGAVSIRKNTERLMRAFERSRVSKSGEWLLVIAGIQKSGLKKFSDLAKELGLENQIRILEYLTIEDLALVHAGAQWFVYPSLYEGFGLPILDSMQCGVPMMASDSTSIPEILGDAGILFDPTHVDEMAAMMDTAAEDRNLRDELIKKGYNRISNFTWDQTALKTLNVLREARS